jgi:hypothetical protein
MKQCTKCGETKPLSEFHKNTSAKSGFGSYCEACHKVQKKAYNEANPEKAKARQKVYRDANREKIKAKRKAYEKANPEKAKAKRKAYYEANREKRKAYEKANREKARDAYLRRTYNISLQEYQTMLEGQGGVCAICGSKGNRKALDVDHCHTTGAVRGLLCPSCNKAQGLLKDDEMLVLKMYKYLAPMGGLEQLFELKQQVMPL